MGKYDDLFEAAAPPAAEGKYSDLFDEPEVVVAEPEPEGGNGLVAKINAWLGGKEGVSERPSQLATDVREAAPEGTPFVHGFGETASHVVPQSWGELGGLAESFFPPIEAYRQVRQGFDIASGKPAPEVIPGITELKDLEDIKAQYGGDSPEYQAAAGKAAGNVLSQMIMAGVLGKSLKVPPRSYVRDTPLVPEPPPTQGMGPGTIADDVRRALQEPERRFTMQEPPPEPPPDIAPAPPVEDMLANVPKEPPVFNPELGPQTIPEFQMPLRTESAVTPGARPLTPGAAKQLARLKAHKAQVEAIGGKVDPDKVTAKIAEIEGVSQEAPVQAPEGVPVTETPVEPPPQGAGAPPEVPPSERGYAGMEPLPQAPQAFSEEPHVSSIANRFTAERAAAGELGEIKPGESIDTMDLVHRGLKMPPEKVNESISRIMQGGDVPINDAAAIRGEEARLSQRSGDLSRAARANPSPEAQLAADNAFKDLTDFHNGPVAQAKRNWHHQGKLMQGEIPVDLSTLNGMREAWLKDTGNPPPAHVEPKLQKVADKLAKAIEDEQAAARNGGEAIEKATRGRKMPSVEEVRNSIADRMKVEPCII